MVDYQKMYTTLFNTMTDVIDQLQRAQQKTEEMYIIGETNQEEENTHRIEIEKSANS